MDIKYQTHSLADVFLIFLFLAVSSAMLIPFYDISFRSSIYCSFFFFSAHLAHSLVFTTLVNSIRFFFSTYTFLRFSLLFIDPFPLIFFFIFLALAPSSAFSAYYFSSFSKIYLLVLSMLPITLGSTVMVSGGSLSSNLCTSPYLFCFFVSNGFISNES